MLPKPQRQPIRTVSRYPNYAAPRLSEEEVNYYVSKFDKKGFTGGINYYPNLNRNWELSAPWGGCEVKVPVKFIVGDLDLVYHKPGVKEFIHNGGFKKMVPLLQEVVMEGVGHFINTGRFLPPV